MRASASLLSILLLARCGGAGDGVAPRFGACVFSTQCPPGDACADGVCRAANVPITEAACGGSQGCAANETCEQGQCVNAPTADTRVDLIGAPCNDWQDCADGMACLPGRDANGAVTSFPGGYCTILDCDATHPCPFDDRCAPVTGSSDAHSICVASCASTICGNRSGYRCSVVGDPKWACLPACSTDADCGDPKLSCADSSCVPRAGCASAADCPTGMQCDATAICRNPCGNDTDCAPDEHCNSFGRCSAIDAPVRACTSASQCRAGEHCVNAQCATLCISDGDCAHGSRCHAGQCSQSGRRACSTDCECPAGMRCHGGSCAA